MGIRCVITPTESYWCLFFGWALYAVLGMYNAPRRRHKALEVVQTLIATAIGSVVLFFVLLLDDFVNSYHQYYYTFGVLVLGHFDPHHTGQVGSLFRGLCER